VAARVRFSRRHGAKGHTILRNTNTINTEEGFLSDAKLAASVGRPKQKSKALRKLEEIGLTKLQAAPGRDTTATLFCGMAATMTDNKKVESDWATELPPDWESKTEAEKKAWDDENFLKWAAQWETPKSGKRKKSARSDRHLGAPLDFMIDVVGLTRGRSAALTAQYIVRQTVVTGSLTVTLSTSELAELRVTRPRRLAALHALEDVGFIRLDRPSPGRKLRVTLLWRPRAHPRDAACS
jgi:hypothetical protein